MLVHSVKNQGACLSFWLSRPGSAQVTVQVSSTQNLASDARANVSSTVTAIIGALAKVR